MFLRANVNSPWNLRLTASLDSPRAGRYNPPRGGLLRRVAFSAISLLDPPAVKKLLLALLVLAALGAAVCVLLLSQPAPPNPAREKATWTAFGYQLHDGPHARRYNLPATIQARPATEATVRLLLDVQDPANYYFVELTRERTRIGKVESGFEAALSADSAQGLGLPGPDQVVVKRRPDTIEVVLNGVVIARAEDESFHGGKLGVGALDDSASVKVGRVQPCEAIDFADDFMKTATEEGGWATVSGSWQVATVRNPSLSSNAFYYVGCAQSDAAPATAVRGEWFWDNYRYRVAAASAGREDVGLYFYYQDKDNYWLFRWNRAAQGNAGGGRKQLIKRCRGQETLVAEAPGGYQPNAWYELEAEVVGPRIRTFIDGHPIFTAEDNAACFGQVGLYSATRAPVNGEFDDVLVQSVRAFTDDFAEPGAKRWVPFAGSWELQASDGRKGYVVAAPQPAKAIAGSSQWRDQTLTASVRLPATLAEASEVGLIGHYLDEANYALFVWRPAAGKARIETRVEGQPPDVQVVDAPRAQAAGAHELQLVWNQSVAAARLDGRPVGSAWAPKLPNGKIGLYASAIEGAAFERVHVAFPLPPEPILTTNEIFEAEDTMAIWAGGANDWEQTYETLGGQYLVPYWHRADFMGDATVELEIKDKAAEAAAKQDVARACRLVLSAESTRSVQSGYNFVLTWPAPGSPTPPLYKATLNRGDKAVATRDLALDTPKLADGKPACAVRRLSLRRVDRRLIASINEEPILAFEDPQPLTGYRAAFATLNLPVNRKDVQVFSGNVKVYTFSKAPSDWRPAAGTWEITNRWECDPRWSFFSGVPDASMLAAIWNKYAFQGDVSIEFAVGPKMETARGGTAYQYARDFNVTICADGRDLTSGYSFLFGGWNNTSTAIVREGKTVASSTYGIPRSAGIHRRWFYVKVEKRGNTLTYWIDGTRILSYTDPQPLPGNRIALWSWDCGIMIARVRISATAIGEREPPGTPLGPCRTIYSLNR